MATKVETAKARTRATRLRPGQRIPVPEPAPEPEDLTRAMYTAVRIAASGRAYLGLPALFATRADAENHLNERQRIEAVGLARGQVDPYVGVVRVEIRPVPEPEEA